MSQPKIRSTVEIMDYGQIDVLCGHFGRGVQLDVEKLEPHVEDGIVYLSRDEAEALAETLHNAVRIANL